MKITDVQACVVGRNEPHSGGSVWTFVRIYTDEGITGTGECNSAGTFTSGFATKETVLTLKSLLIGEDPSNIGPLYETMRRRGRYGGGSSAPFTFALTGIENALFDIVGKALGVPVYKLLGGQFRDRIRLYADCHAGETNDPAAYAAKAQEVVAEGYTAVKFDVDHKAEAKLDRYNWTAGAAEMTHIIDLIAATREGIGYDIDLAIDCHGQFDLPSAITLAKAVEDLRLLWLEEPLPAENIDALAQVRASTSTVICTGENHYTRYDFLELLRQQAVDVIMPDLAKAGGILEAKRIADLADVHYIPVAPHNVSSPLGMMAACHVLASIPNFLVLEFHGRDVAWWEDLCTGDKPFIDAGWMEVSQAPGIGVELDDDVARSMLWGGDTYFSAP
ncbi:MAG: mandelate racemase/muconate lactonizing enzyme family protein [Gemmatimonadetes bacterium]|jgi:galactonate dehydratase|nr:mandelate racemase/muconate lactonizing enzyme family protein [Gemmatimonadota bacterium]MBT6149645.1 mandelate racemase/muconate lactonizing enzyme family protein [Gemmatimonadota bacterium]MBT7863480.1 mandelate racemase/muconate lactonizing enzyme family protein [Gemmatimonadota bacterium]